MGLSDLPADHLASWVDASCAAQGVPARVTDPLVLARVLVLLGGEAAGPRAHARSASTRPDADRSQPPHGLHAVRVQGAGPEDSRADAGVVEDREHDGVLAGQVEARPLSA